MSKIQARSTQLAKRRELMEQSQKMDCFATIDERFSADNKRLLNGYFWKLLARFIKPRLRCNRLPL